MTDEEKDILEFQAYLRDLSPEALWDVLAHLNQDRYPRRWETVRREIDRRRLLFLSPYTAFEQGVRHLCIVCVCLAAFAAFLNLLPTLADAVARLAHQLGAQTLDGTPNTLPVSFGLSEREMEMIFTLRNALRPLTVLGAALLLGSGVLAIKRYRRRQIRREVLATVWIATLLVLLLARGAYL